MELRNSLLAPNTGPGKHQGTASPGLSLTQLLQSDFSNSEDGSGSSSEFLGDHVALEADPAASTVAAPEGAEGLDSTGGMLTTAIPDASHLPAVTQLDTLNKFFKFLTLHHIDHDRVIDNPAASPTPKSSA